MSVGGLGGGGGSGIFVTFQLPSERAGYVQRWTSSEWQAVREAVAAGLPYEGYVQLLLSRRRKQGEDLAAKRQRRAVRWAGIARGEVPPLAFETADALWGDKAGNHSTVQRNARAAAAVAELEAETELVPA